MNIDEVINGWTFEETIKTAENLMEAEKNMFTWDVIRHLRDFAELYREQLKEYQQLEEQGLLLRLPCNIGDTIYEVSYENREFVIKEHIVKEFIYRTYRFPRIEIYCENENGFLVCNNIGKLDECLFLTQAEAEQKLKEMENR